MCEVTMIKGFSIQSDLLHKSILAGKMGGHDVEIFSVGQMKRDGIYKRSAHDVLIRGGRHRVKAHCRKEQPS